MSKSICVYFNLILFELQSKTLSLKRERKKKRRLNFKEKSENPLDGKREQLIDLCGPIFITYYRTEVR